MSDTHFNLYVGALTLSGFLLVALALTGFGSAGKGDRILNGIFGAGFLGYAFYLFLIFDSGTVQEFYFAFFVPVLVISRAVRARRARQEALARQLPPAGELEPVAPAGNPEPVSSSQTPPPVS